MADSSLSLLRLGVPPYPTWYFLVGGPCLVLFFVAQLPVWDGGSTLWQEGWSIVDNIVHAPDLKHVWYWEGWNLIVAAYVVLSGLLLGFLALWVRDFWRWLHGRPSRGRFPGQRNASPA